MTGANLRQSKAAINGEPLPPGDHPLQSTLPDFLRGCSLTGVEGVRGGRVWRRHSAEQPPDVSARRDRPGILYGPGAGA